MQQHLRRGVEVEVTSDEDGFEGVWFRATILSDYFANQQSNSGITTNNRYCLVQYHDLLDEDGKSPLIETVNLRFVRPVPPRRENENAFEVGDTVDAFYNDGWWVGVVCRVLDKTNRVWVYYSTPLDVYPFQCLDLRHHSQWIDGKWAPAGKHLKKYRSLFGSGCTVEICMDCVWFPAIVLRNVNGKYLVKYENCVDGDDSTSLVKTVVDRLHIRPIPPSCGFERNFKESDTVEVRCGVGWRNATIVRVLLERRFDIVFYCTKEAKQVCESDIRPYLIWTDGKWVQGFSTAPKAKDQVGQEKNDACNSDINSNIGSSFTIRSFAKHKASCLSVKKYPMGHLNDHCDISASYATTSKDRKSKLSAIKSISKIARRYKRPKGKAFQSYKLSKTVRREKRPLDTHLEDTVNIFVHPKFGNDREQIRSREENILCKKTTETRKEIEEKNSLKRKMRRPCRLDINSLTSPVTDVLPSQVYEQQNEVREVQIETGKQYQSNDGASDNWPFDKTSILWDTFEHMEVFKSHLQKPHFRPLNICKEGCREGNAIGLMFTYSSTIDKVSRLKLDDPRKTFSSILEVLPDLEIHGFDVISLSDRVNNLLHLKEKHLRLQDEAKDANTKISQFTHDEKELNTEIDEIEQEIVEIEKKNVLLKQKLLHAMSRKESTLAEIGTVQLRAEATNASINDCRLEFEKLAGTPL